LLEKWKEKRHQKMIEKKERLRRKNARMRAEGKEPIKKGWGKMVNTGYGGLNKSYGSDIDKMKETLYRKSEMDELIREKSRENK